MMRNALIYIISVTVLAGCAVIPGTESSYSDTKNTTPLVYSSNQVATQTSKCVINNIDERVPRLTATLSPEMPRQNVLEVRAKSVVGFSAIIEIEPTDKGSLVTVWISNHHIHAKGILMKKFTEGC